MSKEIKKFENVKKQVYIDKKKDLISYEISFKMKLAQGEKK